MNLTKSEVGVFGVYISGRWIGNITDDSTTEEEVESFFREMYPGEDVVAWDNRD